VRHRQFSDRLHEKGPGIEGAASFIKGREGSTGSPAGGGRAACGFDDFGLVVLVVIWALGGYAFAITGPALFDRSLSFYILEKLQQRGGGILESRMGDVFKEEYMPEFRLIDVRLTEQLQSGTIAIDNGCVKLTPRGKRLATLSRFIRTHPVAQASASGRRLYGCACRSLPCEQEGPDRLRVSVNGRNVKQSLLRR